MAAPPALLVPTAGRSSTGLWVTWVLPELHGLDGHRASPLTKLTLVVTQDGGGEVFRKELPASRDGSARQLQVRRPPQPTSFRRNGRR